MRSMWTRGLALALGLIAGRAAAQEAAPIVTLGRPVAASTPATPIATLSRPVALPAEGIRPASFSAGPVVRGVAPDPLPRGEPSLTGWRRSDELPPPVVAPLPPGPGPAFTPPPGGPVAGTPHDTCDPCPADPCIGSHVDGGMAHRWWLSAEYLAWWIKGDQTPPLVAAESAAAGAAAGILPPVSNATILYGNGALATNVRSGLRMFGGTWFGCERIWGVEVGGFFLAENMERFSASSNGDPVLRRPIIQRNPNSPLFGMESGELVAGFGLLSGAVTVTHRSSMWGYEANLKRSLLAGEAFTLDALVGFRALSLDESLGVNESLNVLAANAQGVTGLNLNDKFSTTNRFYGGQVGLQGELWLMERLFLTGTAKVAIGGTWQRVNIDGSTAFLRGNTVVATGVGGLLALPTNIGIQSRSVVTVVPEVGLNLNYQIRPWLRAFAGYNFLYMSDAIRPGAQIDRNVNTSFQPVLTAAGVVNPGVGAAAPAPRLQTSEFWAHGITFGLEFRY